MTKQKNKAPEGFPKKDWDKLSETWKTTAQSKQTKELEKDLIESIKNMSDIPLWFGDPVFHESHQSNLIRKNATYYKLQFPNAREGLDYIWPIR